MAPGFWAAARRKKGGAYPGYVTPFATPQTGRRTSQAAHLFPGEAMAAAIIIGGMLSIKGNLQFLSRRKV
jgi:hypothetical protein